MKLWVTPEALLDMDPDDFDYLVWEYTCYPFSGWKEQLADYAIHGIPESAWEDHEAWTQSYVNRVDGLGRTKG